MNAIEFGASVSSSASNPNSASKTKTHNTDIKALTKLESLPVELIEKIFLSSLNLNLPRASPHLAAALSSERVYRVLILLAFWEADKRRINGTDTLRRVSVRELAELSPEKKKEEEENEGIGMRDIRQILRPLPMDLGGRGFGTAHHQLPLGYGDRMALQSAILRCRWCSVERIRRQLPNLARLVVICWFVGHGCRFKEGESQQLKEFLQSDPGRSDLFEVVVEPEEIRTFTGVVTRKAKKGSGGRMGRNGESLGREDSEEEDDDEHYQVHVRLGEYIGITPLNVRGLVPEMSFFPLLDLMEIPSSLLCADVNSSHRGLIRDSFTDAHMKFLKTLLHSGQLLIQMRYEAYYNTPISYSYRALQRGVHVALTTINPRALDILLKLDDSLSRDPQQSEYIHSIPSEHFQTAAQMRLLQDTPRCENNNGNDAGNKKVQDDTLLCFCLLLYCRAENVPYDDSVIAQFAKDVGGAFGMWLLDLVTDLPRQIAVSNCNYGLFCEREPNRDREMGLRYSEEVLPSGDLFRVPLHWMRVEFYDNSLIPYDLDGGLIYPGPFVPS